METMSGMIGQLLKGLAIFVVKCLFRLISVGPVPEHIAFVMDGNRRHAKKLNEHTIAGHKAGYSSLITMLGYCYELGVKYVTVYAFSIDNFKRSPEEVENLMDLFQEKFERFLEHESIVHRYGIRVYLIGNLKLLSEPVRVSAEKLMKATAKNNKGSLLFCVAYTSCDEVVHAIQESCKSKKCEIQTSKDSVDGSEGVGDYKKMNGLVVHELEEHEDKPRDDAAEPCNEVCEKQMNIPTIKLVDIEKHMYMAVAPDPDIVIRSSGENRLSNFLLWQTANCPLYSPAALWPELGLLHLVWAVLNFQRSYQYLEKNKKKI
ncbi:dehydrodolichyl diphosphate synthase 6-like [Humulus lupulus]|uniref:dehydrodolichyl diphosphate synthase 6-like n=1 Tax=Humulus lupulus TaxID=3486 RepID=UPI002B40C308|nr:dehydrodolichyl diphosphate synthase 6-like [Humulus lupulus]XP_062102760.1 dehydrodolichyl diphosphate synthase 6-like [Humulus lupulus]XP_062102761.1 dehydrodolichyl diphosphate synthase 6-like [Humulus lupulus]